MPSFATSDGMMGGVNDGEEMLMGEVAGTGGGSKRNLVKEAEELTDLGRCVLSHEVWRLIDNKINVLPI